jgi:predicted ATPase
MSLAAQRGVQLIIETHSDHIINGVLKCCFDAERGNRGIDKDNVSIYYFGGKDRNNVSLYDKITIEEGGQLDFQPKGFFDQLEIYQDYLNSYYQHD